MTNAVATTNGVARGAAVTRGTMEGVVIGGDLSRLTSDQRLDYYKSVCESTGLNPLTKPFAYIKLNGKLTLYATRAAADQLRKIHGISIEVVEESIISDLYRVHVRAIDKAGRKDEDVGVVPLPKHGEARANAILKAITKAKRRVTLSIAGLGWLDETEVDSIPGAERLHVDHDTGEVLEQTDDPTPAGQIADEIEEADVEIVDAKPTRPYPADYMRERITEAAAKKGTAAPSEKQIQKTRLDMAGLWPEDDERRAVLSWLFGVTSTKDLTAGQCSVVIDWIGSKEDENGEWLPARHVEAEAGAMLTAARREEHGGELFGDDGTIKTAALEPGGVAE